MILQLKCFVVYKGDNLIKFRIARAEDLGSSEDKHMNNFCAAFRHEGPCSNHEYCRHPCAAATPHVTSFKGLATRRRHRRTEGRVVTRIYFVRIKTSVLPADYRHFVNRMTCSSSNVWTVKSE
jgi:hypothetical protein